MAADRKKGRDPKKTFVMDGDDKKLIPDVRRDFGSGRAIGRTLQFRTVPEGAVQERESSWRITLTPTDVKQPTIALVVCDDAVVGRGRTADVDLAYYGGHKDGVSRQHARLRPTKTGLYLIDLESSNGTQLNGVPVGPGMARKLSEDDAIAFGNLHFTVAFLPLDTD